MLPANIHAIDVSDTHTDITDIQTGNHAHMVMSPLGCKKGDIQSSTLLNALQPEVHSYQSRRAASRADKHSLVPASPQAQRGQQDRQLFSHLCPSSRPTGRNRGRQGRLVTPLQTSEDPVIKEKQHQKRRKRGYKVDCAGKQKYVLPSLSEKEEDAKLCEWLQSLDIADNHERDCATASSQQRLSASKNRGAPGLWEQDTAASHRRDRRPHFLPPICQSDSLLHVPLLFPENSPPPSACPHPNVPIHSLPVPILQPFSPRRK